MGSRQLDFERLALDATEELGSGPDRQQLAVQRRDVVAHAEARFHGRRPWWQLASVAAAAGVVAAVLLLWVWPLAGDNQGSEPEQVRFWVGDETNAASPGRSLQALSDEPLPVTLAGGTRLVLQPGGHARMARADRQEVRMELVQGRVNAAVRNRGGTRWVVAAGPYQVTAVGTQFSVDWDPSEGRVRVAVRAGRVRVAGGNLVDETLQVVAGRVFLADRATRGVEVLPLPAPAAPEHQPVPAPVSPDAGPSSAVQKDQDPRRASPPSDRWRTLLAEGKHEAAIRSIKSTELARLLASLPATDLRDLADAARYAGQSDVAMRILRAIRSRFPKSQAARTAAFLLGKVDADLRRKHASAAQWFTVYLEESPEGPLAQEALGRRIDSNVRAGQNTLAARDARAYLERYPEGPFAALAQSVLRDR